MNVPTQQATQYFNLTLPLGRMVGGDLYKPKTTDSEQRPLVYKTGAKAGQPRVDYYIAIAIPKDAAAPHWSQTPWGQQIGQAGMTLFGNTANRADFAWKITDGDSQVPNTKGKMPCSNEGYPGHWVLHLGRSNPPVIVNQDGSAPIHPTAADPEPVKRGYYVQVAISVTSNGSTQNPGVFLNHNAVSLQYAGTVISSGPDVASMGFGGNAMPAGAQALPAFAIGAPSPQLAGLPQFGAAPQHVAALPGFQPQQQAAPAFQPPVQQQAAPVQFQPVAVQQQAAPAFQPPVQQQAAPNVAFVQQAINPGLQQAAALPAFQPAPQGPAMGPNAQPGVSYAQYQAQGYPDDYMRANGIIL